MKKNMKVFLLFLLIFFMCNNVNATSITLEQIVEKFNNSSIVDSYENVGGSISASNDSDSINVILNVGGKTVDVELLYQENILSIEINEDDEFSSAKLYVTSNIIDVIGQLYGYQEGELTKTLDLDEIKNYTLEEEGYEVENITETSFRINIDITKKIPLVDFSNIYIKASDLQSLKEYISGDGAAEKSKGNVWFNKLGYDNEYTLLVAEKEGLTENTYKSILSILEVTFDNEKVIQYFKSNYSNVSIGDKEFDGFSIKVNPEIKTEREENLIPFDSGYEFVRIIIDKSVAVSKASEIVDIEKENSNNVQTQEENKIILYIIASVCSVILIFVFVIILKNKSKKKEENNILKNNQANDFEMNSYVNNNIQNENMEINFLENKNIQNSSKDQ